MALSLGDKINLSQKKATSVADQNAAGGSREGSTSWEHHLMSKSAAA